MRAAIIHLARVVHRQGFGAGRGGYNPAITTAVRPRRSCNRSHRSILPVRRLLGLGLAALVVISACSDDKKPNAVNAQPALEVEAATCLQVDDSLGATVSALPVVSCNLAHTHEIFAKVGYPSPDLFPGMAKLETFAEGECLARFEKYVGINVFDSALFVSWIMPSLDSWTQKKDYNVLCVFGMKDGSKLTGSAKGKKI
jgi:hypothetical protein